MFYLFGEDAKTLKGSMTIVGQYVQLQCYP
jgi:hypothetical protein